MIRGPARSAVPLFAVAMTLCVLLSCRDRPNEGTEPGDCSDRADTDSDGLFDCDDPDCAGSPDCAGDDDDSAPEDDDGDDDDSAVPTFVDFELGPTVVCEAPVLGIDRFREEGADRGLTMILQDPEALWGAASEGTGGSVVAQDMDRDGDMDIVIGRIDGAPWLLENDGNGQFVEHAVSLAPEEQAIQQVSVLSALDITGDRLPEIVLSAGGYMAYLPNEGAMTFGPPVLAYIEDDGAQVYMTQVWGDADRDGDLDVVLPGTGPVGLGPGEGLELGGPDRLLLGEDGNWSLALELIVAEEGSRTQVALFTDRDADGDPDLFIPADLGPPSGFYRNDGNDPAGVPIFIEDAAAIGADLVMAAMGIDSADLNQDGVLDYCITDVGRPKCLLSDSSGLWFEAGLALGILPEVEVGFDGTIGWGLNLADLDNDGFLELVQASGPDQGAVLEGQLEYPDLLWHGQPDGTFVDVSALVGFDDLAVNYGMVTADFNGDGYLDLLVTGPQHRPSLYMNQCGAEAWLLVELEGLAGNTEAMGAWVEVVVGATTRIREVYNLRTQSQTPSRVHFGLGDVDTVDLLRVRWPDGTVTERANVDTRRVIVASHPQRED
ncbi:MAG: hypothetical protein CL928_14200 [Deltaproteobacteria bacterium]|nr:hypothetical protein [Deltaproteobacteria bacterium]